MAEGVRIFMARFEEEFRSQESEFSLAILYEWRMNHGLEQAILIVEIKKNFPLLETHKLGHGVILTSGF
jgi:hypothetical protein